MQIFRDVATHLQFGNMRCISLSTLEELQWETCNWANPDAFAYWPAYPTGGGGLKKLAAPFNHEPPPPAGRGGLDCYYWVLPPSPFKDHWLQGFPKLSLHLTAFCDSVVVFCDLVTLVTLCRAILLLSSDCE